MNELEQIDNKLKDIYKDFTYNITNIYHREDLLLAIDLVYHSVLSFNFVGQRESKGWVECLILGDTRTGKSKSAEKILRHYRIGELCTGENTTYAGLVGGMQQVGKKWMISWGKIPLNNRKLLIIDEISGLNVDLISSMSSVRSSGVAEIVKIQTEKTSAKTRLLWMSNPRGDKKLDTYNYGIEAIKELIGRVEDVARFDFAITVASGEVDTDEINKIKQEEVKHKYTSKLCNNLIMWCWSRTPEQIIIDEETTKEILKVSTFLGNKYSSKIPLVEPAEQRIKISRLAIALAGRLFSTDATGEKLIVRPEHARYIYIYLDRMYSKASMNYDVFSAEHKQVTEMSKERQKELSEYFKTFSDWKDLRDVLLNCKTYRLKDISEQLDWEDMYTKSFNRWCNKHKLIEATTYGFKKLPVFTSFLKSLLDSKIKEEEIEL